VQGHRTTTGPVTVNNSHVTCTESSTASRIKVGSRASIKAVPRLRRVRSRYELATRSASPSHALIAALGSVAQHYRKPRIFSNKLDLSYCAPILLSKYHISSLRKTATSSALRHNPPKTQLTILVQYIQNLHPLVRSCRLADDLRSRTPDFDTTLLKTFDDESLKLLQLKGWSVSDLMSWTWILTAKSAAKAATRLMMLASPSDGMSGVLIPTFVFLLLLRRRDMNGYALKLLMVHAWHRLLGTPRNKWATKSKVGLEIAAMPQSWPQRMRNGRATRSVVYQPMSETTIMTVIVRLLRHCRKLWPAACVSVAKMITNYVNGTSPGDSPTPTLVLPEQTFARLTFLYNKALSLLSLPSSINPFQSVAYHQRAQFILLRKMNEFEPALAINVEGYRAVTRVQLAHRKTFRERQWADMKAISWPPWKEEKSRMDVDIGPEHGVSRASESMYRSKEAGYAPHDWERAAGILAGWDTDRSPTIQTRAWFQQPLVPRRIITSSHSAQPERDGNVWAARIRATRTLDEGWVCFLAYKDQKSNPSQGPYYAMFEKLVFEDKRRRKSDNSGKLDLAKGNTSNTLAGDGKELLPKPEDPRISIYVRTPPPSVEEFFNSMIEDKMYPSGRFLAFLLSHAESFHAGVKYLRASRLPPQTIIALLNQDLGKDSVTRANLESVPQYIFAAFIRFLSRFAPRFSHKFTGSVDHMSISITSPTRDHKSVLRPRATRVNPLLHAFRLMACRRPYYRPPWNALLCALARAGTAVDSGLTSEDPSVQDLLTWIAICDLLHQMREIRLDLDLQGFQMVLIALEKAIFASESLIQGSKKPVPLPDPQSPIHRQSIPEKSDYYTRSRREAEKVLLHGVPHVKKIFKGLVTSGIVRDETTSSDSDELSQWVNDHGFLAASALLPRLLEVPSPAHLHALIRVLGLRADYTGMLDLVQWMSRFMPEIKAVIEEAGNGSRMMRRCVVAVRVFLERYWLHSEAEAENDAEVDAEADAEADVEADAEDSGLVDEGASIEMIEKVHDIVERNEEWGGWPSDKEMEEYCRKGRFIYSITQLTNT